MDRGIHCNLSIIIICSVGLNILYRPPSVPIEMTKGKVHGEVYIIIGHTCHNSKGVSVQVKAVVPIFKQRAH